MRVTRRSAGRCRSEAHCEPQLASKRVSQISPDSGEAVPWRCVARLCQRRPQRSGARSAETGNRLKPGLGERAATWSRSALETQPSGGTMSPDRHARTMLPIPHRPSFGLTTYDAKDPDTAYPPIEPLLPPEGAPNVLIVLLDDVGFGAASTFGGPCHTPTADRLAAGGLTYNR